MRVCKRTNLQYWIVNVKCFTVKANGLKQILLFPSGGEGQLPKPIMIGVAVGAGLLLFLVIGILVLYRRKSTESSRVSWIQILQNCEGVNLLSLSLSLSLFLFAKINRSRKCL